MSRVVEGGNPMNTTGQGIREAIRAIVKAWDDGILQMHPLFIDKELRRVERAYTILRRTVSGEVNERGWSPGESVRVVPGAKDRGG